MPVKELRKNIQPPDDIIVLAVRALSGEVTPTMRRVAFGYTGDAATFRFYMDREPTEDERENGEVVAVNFEAGHPSKLTKLDVEFIVTKEPIGFLDGLDFLIFSRCED